VHWTTLSVFGMGTSAQTPVTWPIVDFTGLPAPSPADQYQRARSTSYGSMGFQVNSSGMGYWINTDSATAFNNYMGARIYYIWNQSDDIRPWDSGRYGSSPVLRAEAQWFKHQHSLSNGGIFFGQLGVTVVDVVHQKAVFFTWTLWDSRGSSEYREYVHGDTGGTSNPIVTTVLAGGTQYCTKLSTSQATGSVGGLFGARVSRTQLVNAINDCNSLMGSGLSTNPNDYRLVHLWCGGEGYRPTSSARITAGYRTYTLNCLTEY
jgi:hypothetical protein